MKETKVAIRYAKSLINLSQEKNQLDAVNADMSMIASTCEQNHELVVVLNSPVIKTDKKINILNAIFKDKVSPMTAGFLTLMCAKKREYLLPEIAVQFASQFNEIRGIVTAFVKSAVPLDDNIKSQIKAKIGVDTPIEFKEIIDPSLIGGFIVRVGDKQFDGSIARSLVELRKTFNKNEYIPGF